MEKMPTLETGFASFVSAEKNLLSGLSGTARMAGDILAEITSLVADGKKYDAHTSE